MPKSRVIELLKYTMELKTHHDEGFVLECLQAALLAQSLGGTTPGMNNQTCIMYYMMQG